METSPKTKTKKERIISLVRGHPEGISPKTLSFYSSINENTVKSCLAKLKREGVVKIKDNTNGIYVLVEDNPYRALFDFKFQNLFLTCVMNSCEKEFEPTDLILIENMLKVNFGISSNTKKATLHLSSAHGLNINAILFVAQWFIDKIKNYAGIEVSFSDIIVASIEFNKDFSNLRLDGSNCITIDSLIAEYKLYQKENCVREEFKPKVPIPFPVLREMLTHGPLYVDVSNRISLQEKKMSELIYNQNEQIKLINKLLDFVYEKRGVM